MTVHSEEAQVNISKGGDPDLFNVVSKYWNLKCVRVKRKFPRIAGNWAKIWSGCLHNTSVQRCRHILLHNLDPLHFEKALLRHSIDALKNAVIGSNSFTVVSMQMRSSQLTRWFITYHQGSWIRSQEKVFVVLKNDSVIYSNTLP
jgi:hypothetical protein